MINCNEPVKSGLYWIFYMYIQFLDRIRAKKEPPRNDAQLGNNRRISHADWQILSSPMANMFHTSIWQRVTFRSQ